MSLDIIITFIFTALGLLAIAVIRHVLLHWLDGLGHERTERAKREQGRDNE